MAVSCAVHSGQRRALTGIVLVHSGHSSGSSCARRLIGEYRPTAKNALVRELYPRLGFQEISRSGEATLYALPLDGRAGEGVEFIKMSEGRSPAAAG